MDGSPKSRKAPTPGGNPSIPEGTTHENYTGTSSTGSESRNKESEGPPERDAKKHFGVYRPGPDGENFAEHTGDGGQTSVGSTLTKAGLK